MWNVGDIVENSAGMKYSRIEEIPRATVTYYVVQYCYSTANGCRWNSRVMVDGSYFKRKLPPEEVIMLQLQGMLP